MCKRKKDTTEQKITRKRKQTKKKERKKEKEREREKKKNVRTGQLGADIGSLPFPKF